MNFFDAVQNLLKFFVGRFKEINLLENRERFFLQVVLNYVT